MRIGINAPFRMQGGGLVHLRQLLRAWGESGILLENEIVLFAREECISALELPSSPNIDVQPIAHLHSIGRLVWEQTTLPRQLDRARLDVLFCPGNIAPLRSPVPTVVAMRNAAPFCDEVNFRTVGLRNTASFLTLGHMMRLSARSASRVIFVSHFLRDIFIRKFGIPLDRTDVIYHGRDGLRGEAQGAHSSMGEAPGSYLLTVSHLYRYKNLPALIQGIGLVRQLLRERGLKLLLVGRPKNESYGDELRTLVRSLDLRETVIFKGSAPHHEILPLLRNCHSFVFQSLAENCPNTLIEALSAGLPIACSNAGVMPEIAGNGVFYFDPKDPSLIAEALARLVTDEELRSGLRQRALQESIRFPTWKEAGAMTLCSLAKAAGLVSNEVERPELAF